MTWKEWRGPAGLPRRTLLKAGATIIASAALPGQAAFANEGADMWDRLTENAADFRKAATRRGFVSRWDDPRPILVSIRPPAIEAEIVAVERQIGEPLPKVLRHFYANFSSGIHISWLMPGRSKKTEEGVGYAEFDEDTLSPPPFRRTCKSWVTNAETLEPTIFGGDLRFSLADVPREVANTRASAASFREAAADDKDYELHYTRYAEWWERGFPLGNNGGGDMIAIDKQDEAGRMMFLSHEGADEPGWFIDHDLLGYLLAQSRIGFTGFHGIAFGNFSSRGIEPGERERKYREERPGDVEAGLALPSTFRLDADSNDARIWREWLGLKQG